MKNILFILMLLSIQTTFGQTPEEQRMIDKALKVRDSIMQCITLEEMLQQANAQKKRKVNTRETNPIPKNLKNEDKYWLNTILSWVYVDEAYAINAFENWKGDLRNTGTPLMVEINVTYNLSFKPGWNL